MKTKIILSIACLFLLVACAQSELPPEPKAPGQAVRGIGRALGGIAVPAASLPSWAASITDTDITPTTAKDGDVINVTVEKPSAVTTNYYAYGKAYFYNSKLTPAKWEVVDAIDAKSGARPNAASNWRIGKAFFQIPASKTNFEDGTNHLVTYWCYDSGTKTSNNQIAWTCSGNGKWGIGAFEFITAITPPDTTPPAKCGNNIKDTGEDCDTGITGISCQTGYQCVACKCTAIPSPSPVPQITMTDCAGTTVISGTPVQTNCAETTITEAITTTTCPAGTTTPLLGSAVYNQQILNSRTTGASILTSSKGITSINASSTANTTQLALTIIASMGILVITLLNFVHKGDEGKTFK